MRHQNPQEVCFGSIKIITSSQARTLSHCVITDVTVLGPQGSKLIQAIKKEPAIATTPNPLIFDENVCFAYAD